MGEFEDQPFDFANGLNVDEVTTRTVDAFMTLDMTVAYDVSDATTLTFGASNLLDEEPPFAIGDANNDLYGYVQGQHDPRGQFLFAKATFRF